MDTHHPPPPSVELLIGLDYCLHRDMYGDDGLDMILAMIEQELSQ